MMPPFDTALLKHQPDYLRPRSKAKSEADKRLSATRVTFGQFIARVFAGTARSGQVTPFAKSAA